MKVNLVVTQGVHAGKKIPVAVTSEFFIGRDPQCQLRPASPSISKQHCGILVKGSDVLVRDCGSTNGTFVNNEQIAGERMVANGDTLRVGPLEFTLSIEVAKPSVTETVSAKAPSAETIVAKPAVKVAAAAPVVAAKVETAVAKAGDTTVDTGDVDADAESMAAMMLFEDAAASGTPTVENFNAESTTVMEMPALGATGKPGAAPAAKKEEKKVHGDSSSAAAEALSKYMRRPRT